ncbi:hypothetical protein [Ligilactobacillus apodemi]|uniref:hypothetical protein n=1 Tax=Ligilactobacillus apodemi TaxID=307126 RepID=UPI00046A2665|nr:hypothetical protein [Ligilactobacillus apodemi]
MRYTDTVIFVVKANKHYDPDAGKIVGGELMKTKRRCHVSSPSLSKSVLVFGDLKTSDILIHLKRRYTDTYDYCLVNDRKYFFVRENIVNRRQVIVVRGDSS